MTLEQTQKLKISTLDRVFYNVQSNGMPYTYIDNKTYHLQCRNKDMTNWGNVIDYYRNEGANDEQVELMTLEDVGMYFTVADALNVLTSIRQYYGILYKVKWEIRKLINKSENIETLEQMDIEVEFNNVLNNITGGL